MREGDGRVRRRGFGRRGGGWTNYGEKIMINLYFIQIFVVLRRN